MSIRLKQLLLLLVIALVPVLISGLLSERRTQQMADKIAATTRFQEMERERHYMREKVADIGTALQLISRYTELQLERQARLLEKALDQAPPTGRQPILNSGTLKAVDRTRPSFLVADAGCLQDCEMKIQKLAATAEQLRDIYRGSEQFSLWHYAGFSNGLNMVFPGHGNYPGDYDPRARPWYRATVASGQTTWLPMTIDASTGQPVLTAATPLRDTSGAIIGVTAIDLPLGKLLFFESDAAPWLNVARLGLLKLDAGETLRVIASQQPLNVGSDWRSGEQTLTISALTSDQIDRMRTLSRGESMLFDNITLGADSFNLAVTAINTSGDEWLALLSPHSATEAAVAAALGVVESARRQSLEQHLLGAAVLAALVALIAVLAAHQVTAPLIKMSNTAEDIAAGRLDSRTGLKRSDELGALSTSIDRMADSIERLQIEQEQAYRDMIMTLHRALEKKDAYTAGHSGRVTRTSLKLGQRIGLDEPTLEKLRFGALTHDLGKIGIADAVLNKPAPLEGDEIAIMRQHPTFSKTIMKPLVRFQEYAEIAGSHHEHWDGSGYPDGLQGEEIHLLARIVAIADAWDSMIGDRVYRKGMPIERALAILESEQDEGQFDPHLIREFIAMMREENPPSSNGTLKPEKNS